MGVRHEICVQKWDWLQKSWFISRPVMLGSLTCVLWTVCRITLRTHRLCQTCRDLQTWLQWPWRRVKRPPNVENVSLSTWTQNLPLFEVATAFNTQELKEKKPQSWVFVVVNINKRAGDTEEGKRCLLKVPCGSHLQDQSLQSANEGTEGNLERAVLLIQPEHTALIVSWRAD